MAYSTPRTWSAGEKPTAAQFNANIRDNVAFLASPPACRVYNSGNQSISGSTETTLSFDSERYDTDSMHSTSVNTSRITFNTAGLYEIKAQVSWAAGTGTWSSYAVIRLNGTTVLDQDTRLAATTFGASLKPSTTYKFSAGDYIEVRVWQNSGTLNVTATSNYSPEFSATWIGLGT